MSFTFLQLKTAIQDYTDNSETTFVNHLNDFIKNSAANLRFPYIPSGLQIVFSFTELFLKFP